MDKLENRIFFVIHYGIKRFNDDGTERAGGVDCTSGAFYSDVHKAQEKQKFWFEGQIEEMMHHTPHVRERECAYSYIEAVTDVSEDSDGEEVEWDRLDDDTKAAINASILEVRGCDFRCNSDDEEDDE